MAFNLIKFKKGTLAGLETLKTNNQVEEGTFYLTIDEGKNTSRLFIGTNGTTALPVNHSIITVATTTDLDSSSNTTPYQDGDFAYVTQGNILAVKKGNAWVQINAPDSRAIKDLTPSIATNSGVATITWTLRDQNNNAIQTNDATPVAPAISMKGANGITVSSEDREITITGDSYQLSSAAVVQNSDTATISLKHGADGNTSAGSITVTGGDNVSITGTANNVVISANDSTISDVIVANHATSGFNITVKDTSNASDTAQLDPKITLGTHTAASDQISFVNGVANLPVYTKDEIDAQNRSINAMVYKGTIGADSNAYASSISGITANGMPALHVGDTFKLLGDSTATYNVPTRGGGTVVAHGGDLIIANGTESSGDITADSLYYDIVPSGDEKTVYKGLGAQNTGNGIQVEDGTNTIIASLEVAAGTQMAVSSSHTGDNGEKAVVTVSHAQISTSTNGNVSTGTLTSTNTQAIGGELIINAVTGLTTNNGHVTGVTVTPFKVVDTQAKLDTTNSRVAITATPASGSVGNYATVTSTVALVDEDNAAINSKDLAFKLGSDNLTITKSGDDKVMANFVWGSF